MTDMTIDNVVAIAHRLETPVNNISALPDARGLLSIIEQLCLDTITVEPGTGYDDNYYFTYYKIRAVTVDENAFNQANKADVLKEVDQFWGVEEESDFNASMLEEIVNNYEFDEHLEYTGIDFKELSHRVGTEEFTKESLKAFIDKVMRDDVAALQSALSDIAA